MDLASNPYAALLARKAQLQAQEQAALSPPEPVRANPFPPAAGMGMGQAGFSGYGQGRPQMSPQQAAQLRMLLQSRVQNPLMAGE